MSLVSAVREEEDLDEVAAVTGIAAGTELVEVDERDIGLTVGNLPSALDGVVSVNPQATFEQAITEMLLNDFSQLPALAGKHNLHGVIT